MQTITPPTRITGRVTRRNGRTGASSYGLIDDLTFTLDGNWLTCVDDAATSPAYNNGFEFKDAVKQDNEYTYDKNGNMTKDLNKNITDIQYNSLNLSVIRFGGNTNQVYHTFRHTDALGLDRSLVQSMIRTHLETVSSQVVADRPFNQIIRVGGRNIQYTAFKLLI